MKVDYILKFGKSGRKALWGEELWLVSSHKSAPSIIANGPLAGTALDVAIPGFRILVKRILAKDRLSVQVHPNEETSRIVGGEPKTEAWLALADSSVYAGFNPGVSRQDVSDAVAFAGFDRILARHALARHSAVLIPGGLVHAIDAGADLLEVQQSSDTTFRLYDWGRTGPDGRPRELHVAQAMAAADLSIPPPAAVGEVSCRFFGLRGMRVSGAVTLRSDSEHLCIYVTEGELSANGEKVRAGEPALVPVGVTAAIASSGAYAVVASAPAC